MNYYYYSDEKDVSELIGSTVIKIEGMKKGSREIYFTLSNGNRYIMYHDQDCCESVELEDVCGNYEDLLNTPILKFSEDTNDCLDESELTVDEWVESYTWTFYTIATAKGIVTLRWFGESNGYYSESVDFAKISDDGDF